MRRPASRTRTLIAVTGGMLAAALALAGCSSGDGEEPEPSESATETPEPEATSAPEDVAALETVTVDGDPGAEPTLDFETPFELAGVAAIVETPGTGADLEEGQELLLDYVIVSGEDKSVLGSTWQQGEQDRFVLGDESIVGQLTSALRGQQVGVRVLFGVPGTEAQEATETTEAVPAQPSTIMAIEVTDAVDVPKRAEGEAVEPPAGLPEVTLDDDGKPSIEVPSDAEEPTELVAQTLIEGEGDPVEAGQTVKVHYTGWLWDGTQFDSSWDRGAPFDAPLVQGQLIDGWVEGLAGKPVGSQVLLVVPSEKGYGAQGSGETIPPDATLIFVVDILGVS